MLILKLQKSKSNTHKSTIKVMEPISLMILLFVILIWITVMKNSKDMKKEFDELKKYLKERES